VTACCSAASVLRQSLRPLYDFARVECSGGGGDNRHEPVVLRSKPLVVLGHLGAVGPVERVIVTGVLRAPPADRMHDGEIKCRTNTRSKGDLPLEKILVNICYPKAGASSQI